MIVNGYWSQWSTWESCSVTCGGGNQSRDRTCTEPAPQYGGDYCNGNSTSVKSCSEMPCPSTFFNILIYIHISMKRINVYTININL